MTALRNAPAHRTQAAGKASLDPLVGILVEALKDCAHDIHVFRTCRCQPSFLTDCLKSARSAIKKANNSIMLRSERSERR
jgi:hypothetical protein